MAFINNLSVGLGLGHKHSKLKKSSWLTVRIDAHSVYGY